MSSQIPRSATSVPFSTDYNSLFPRVKVRISEDLGDLIFSFIVNDRKTCVAASQLNRAWNVRTNQAVIRSFRNAIRSALNSIRLTESELKVKEFFYKYGLDPTAQKYLDGFNPSSHRFVQTPRLREQSKLPRMTRGLPRPLYLTINRSIKQTKELLSNIGDSLDYDFAFLLNQLDLKSAQKIYNLLEKFWVVSKTTLRREANYWSGSKITHINNEPLALNPSDEGEDDFFSIDWETMQDYLRTVYNPEKVEQIALVARTPELKGQTLIHLAETLQKQGEYKQASRILDLLTSDPGSWSKKYTTFFSCRYDLFCRSSDLFMKMKQYDHVVRVARTLLESEDLPDFDLAYMGRWVARAAAKLFKTGYLQEARSAVDLVVNTEKRISHKQETLPAMFNDFEVVDLWVKVDALTQAASLLLQMGDLKQARSVLDDAKLAARRTSPYHSGKDKKLRFLAETSKRLSRAEELSSRPRWRY